MPGSFGQKPSNSHVVWRSGANGGRKRFDFEYLELWAAQFGVDYDTRTRTDHERAAETREQHLCVFEWTETEGEEISMGDKSWTMGTKRTPRTFIEIDEEGAARLKGWSEEAVLDIEELWIDGSVLKMRAAERGKTALDARKLLSDRRKHSA